MSFRQQELSSCWDMRPFGHNRYISRKVGELLFPFLGNGFLSNTV